MIKLKRLASMLTVFCMLFSLVTYADEVKKEEEAYYRQEKTIKLKDSDIKLNLDGTIEVKNKEVKKILENNKNIKEKVIKELEEGHTLTDYKSVEVYVTETLAYVDEELQIIDSRFMTNDEVEEYLDQIDNKNLNVEDISVSLSYSDSQKKGKLTIYIFRFDTGSYKYKIATEAEWSGYGSSGSDNPATGDDFVGITWGGDGELKATSYSITGFYKHSGNSVKYNRTESNYQKGYIWSFPEYIQHEFIGDYAYYTRAEVELAKTYTPVKNKKTGARFSYIHTYTTSGVNVGLNPAGLGLTTSGNSNHWKIEVEITELLY
ncbi:hypothetical protein CACET_c23870 [Clostridium aceticum]|uniref:Uncharacterized protein n=1 Tax=Clostridium aceticum TaxID=84022 RepID=A0A0D8I8A2_9CLOT|nr:hypothetical protein [Clostridium aceticum]AKL95833.1 hypothetical protein CACET_c23870 [Clostridium aceticum]KJF25451.1 hypothetical protein TZ02_18565 [Clostridium aceticum]